MSEGPEDHIPADVPPDVALRGAALRRRASAGVFVVGSRGVAVLLLGFAGYVVLARLLSPPEFGIYAVGLVFVSVAALLSDGGLGAGIIRRPKPPDEEELQALVGFQLVVTISLAVVVAIAAGAFGTTGWVSAALVAVMPLVAFQFPARILLERSLHFQPLAVVEVTQVLTYHLSAITLVVLGLGVWGLVLAYVLRTIVGTVLLVRVGPPGFVAPRLRWARIRPLMAFGVRFQATTGTELLRDQGMNWAVAAVASLTTLGLWSLVRRLMEAPLLLVDTFERVAFSTMSRLVEAKEDSGRLIERVVGIAAVGTGIPLAALAGSAEGLVPGVFGTQWSGAAGAVPWTCLALAVSGSISVATRSHLYAVGNAAIVLRASTVQTAAVFAVTLPLLPHLGVAAVGLGWLTSSLLEAAVLDWATRRVTDARPARPLVVPVGVGVLGAACGWVVTRQSLTVWGLDHLPAGIAGAATAGTVFLAGMVVFNRVLLRDAFTFTLSAVRAGLSRERE